MKRVQPCCCSVDSRTVPGQMLSSLGIGLMLFPQGWNSHLLVRVSGMVHGSQRKEE